jgi:hypothetical protein
MRRIPLAALTALLILASTLAACGISARPSGVPATPSADPTAPTLGGRVGESGPALLLPTLVGTPTDRSATISVVRDADAEAYVEYGAASGTYVAATGIEVLAAGEPALFMIEGLAPGARCYYRVRSRTPGGGDFAADPEGSFVTGRSPGETFMFTIQGDSHIERAKQFDAELYRLTLRNAAASAPDFHFAMGDDFSVDTMKTFTQQGIEAIYAVQRAFLGLLGGSSPVFLVNGNHEQAARYLLDGTDANVAVWAQNARNRYFPEPAPDGFYSGDPEPVPAIGLLRDYYSFEWGDALFVVIDPYWHSPVAVDNELGGRDKATDGGKADAWSATIGDAQYRWLRSTLEASDARCKFVFTHHVLGTGRGGAILADLYEWGGEDRNGRDLFKTKRPGWAEPIQDLMARTGVTIFFQGHDHVFAKEVVDGVVYQTLPEPADPNYALYFADSYPGALVAANSGHVRVTVSPASVRVEYVRSVLPEDEREGFRNGDIVLSYEAVAR